MSDDKVTKIILEKLNCLDRKVDEVRTKDLPGIHTAMSVLRVQVEERTGKKATAISAIGGAIAVITSIGVSVAAMMLR